MTIGPGGGCQANMNPPTSARALLTGASHQRILCSLGRLPCRDSCCVKRIRLMVPTNHFLSSYCVTDAHASLSSRALRRPTSLFSLWRLAAGARRACAPGSARTPPAELGPQATVATLLLAEAAPLTPLPSLWDQHGWCAAKGGGRTEPRWIGRHSPWGHPGPSTACQDQNLAEAPSR